MDVIKTTLKDERIRQGLSLKDLSNKVGLSPATISRYENQEGKYRLKELTVLRIAIALNLKYRWVNDKEFGESLEIGRCITNE